MDILQKYVPEAPPDTRLPAEHQANLLGIGLLLAALLWITLPLLGLGIADYAEHHGMLWSLVDGANLIFHEAGHIVFLLFGRFLMVLGGSLLQVLIPLLCLAVFWFKEKNRPGGAVCLWWLGTNLMDVGVYANDARDLQLFLITGGTGREVEGHDWEYLLGELNLLSADHAIGGGLYLAGKLCLLAGIGFLLLTAYNEWRTLRGRRAEA
jgi:hypothetical protein